MKIWVLGLCVMLTLGACDSGPESFEDAQAVADAMEDEGIECEDLETTTEFSNDQDSLVTERGLCQVDGSPVVISMFENAAARNDWVAVGKLFDEVAVGENWVVSADSEDVVQDVRDSLNATTPDKE
jgi:hypothetical protein